MGDEKWLRKIQRIKLQKQITVWIIQLMQTQIIWIVIIQAKVV